MKGVKTMANDDLLQLSITEAADMVRRRQVSPVELTEAALAQAERPPALHQLLHHPDGRSSLDPSPRARSSLGAW